MGPDDQLLMLAWRIINDSLRTDVCLLYPPYQIAIGKIQIIFLIVYCIVLQGKFMAINFILYRLSANSLRDIAERSQIMVRRIKRRYGKDSRNSTLYNKFV